MLVLLPIAALGACVLAIKGWVASWREAILGGAVVWGVVLVCSTEGLSVLHALTALDLALAWAAVILVGAVVVRRARTFQQLFVLQSAHSLGRLRMVMLGALLGMLLLLGVIAVLSPPNTWDSMTYHMARLEHWSENASLEPYPTHILRQLYLQPGAEFVLLHLQILSGGDHLAGLVQWASMLGVLLGVSLLAHELGACWPGAVCASIFAASLPIGILESTSTQNDYVVAFWSVCACVFALRLIRSSATSGVCMSAAGFGSSTGLAILTKATAYIILVPVLLLVSACLMRRAGWRGLRVLAAAGAIALTINAGFYARNWIVFRSPIGPLDEGAPSLRYVNASLTPSLLVSNLVRDIGVNLNATPLVALNVRAVNFVKLVHMSMRVDLADPRTTWGEEVFAEQPVGLAFDENFASNPLHLGLLSVALAAVWLRRRRLPDRSRIYAVTLAGAFLLFAIVLRWQPWDTRLELPFFVLGAPLVGLVAERAAPRLAGALACLLLVSMVPWVVYNQARPLVGPRSILAFSRDQQYFTNRPGLRSAYLDAVGYLVDRGCDRVGLVSTVDGWEYPLWPLAGEALRRPLQVEHVGVSNVSAAQTRAFDPCAVLVLGPNATAESLDLDGTPYRSRLARLDPAAELDQVAVFTGDHP